MISVVYLDIHFVRVRVRAEKRYAAFHLPDWMLESRIFTWLLKNQRKFFKSDAGYLEQNYKTNYFTRPVIEFGNVCNDINCQISTWDTF